MLWEGTGKQEGTELLLVCRPLVQNHFHDMFLHPEASPVADGEGAIFTRV